MDQKIKNQKSRKYFKTIGFVVPSLNNPYFLDMVDAAKREVSKYPGTKLIIKAPKAGAADAKRQVEIIKEMISKQFDSLVLVPSDSRIVVPTILKANRSDIPVVILDNKLDEQEVKAKGAHTVTYIGSDNFTGGQKAGEILVKHLNGSGSVAILEGSAENQAAIERKNGFRYIVKKYTNIKIVASRSADWSRQKGFIIFGKILKDYPDISAVFACNDEMAFGAIDAIRAAGKTGKIKVIGFDATQDAIKAVEVGLMTATISQQPTKIGKLGIEKSMGILDGKFSESRQKIILPLKTMKKVVDEISPFCRGLVFTGDTGDPLVNPHTLDVAEYAEKKGLNLGLITNGQCIDQARAKRIIKAFTWVRFSIDAATPQSYQLIRGVGKQEFDRTWANARMLCTFRDKYNKSCTVGAKFLTDAHRISEMALFAKMAKQTGFNYCEFKPFHQSTTDVREVIQAIRQQYENKFFKVIGIDQDYIDMQHRYNKKATYEAPYAYNFRCVITASLDIHPTCHTRSIKKFSYGNLYQHTFKEIWFSPKKKQILNNLLKDPDCPPQCYKEENHLALQQLRQAFLRGNYPFIKQKFDQVATLDDPHQDFVG